MAGADPSQKKRTAIHQRLPWWIELLFVQVGLPDAWLRSFLKTKKWSHQYLQRNKRNIRFFTLLIFGFIYLQPLVKESRSHNMCVKSASTYIKSNKFIKTISNDEMNEALANRFCNGGDLNL